MVKVSPWNGAPPTGPLCAVPDGAGLTGRSILCGLLSGDFPRAVWDREVLHAPRPGGLDAREPAPSGEGWQTLVACGDGPACAWPEARGQPVRGLAHGVVERIIRVDARGAVT